MRPSNIFVFGLDDFHLAQLETLGGRDEYRFHELYRHEEVKPSGEEFPVAELLKGAAARLDTFEGPVDAIVGYWDFPVSTMLPLLRRPWDLPSPSFEAVLKCEHKYWSRREQQAACPEVTPGFCAIDPFADDPAGQLDIEYPFWIKPVKAASSYLGFKVHNRHELEHALDRSRRGIKRFGNPFNYLLEFADIPSEIAPVDGNHCIAEQIIAADRQCTLEGYVHSGEVVVYGIVDSFRSGFSPSSFTRYQYPTTLPETVRERMIGIADRFLRHIGYDDSPFNMEFFWDSITEELWLLEINTRISKSHAPLFQLVDGMYHHKVMVDTALGRKPDFPQRRGEHRYAAKFMWRVVSDAIVSRVPSEKEIQRLRARVPELMIQIHVKKGMRLSELSDQDSYTYEIAVLFLGGDSESELQEKYAVCQESLHLHLHPIS
jgi:biotin carboxylase